MTFATWKNEVADMPTQSPCGKWYDLETGISFETWKKSQATSRRSSAPRTQLNKEALNDRAYSKQLGGEALTGTKKQKEWAEKIRAEKLRAASNEARNALATHSKMQTAKFWIENRNMSSNEIYELLKKRGELYDAYHELKERSFDKEANKVREEFWAINKKLGI